MLPTENKAIRGSVESFRVSYHYPDVNLFIICSANRNSAGSALCFTASSPFVFIVLKVKRIKKLHRFNSVTYGERLE